MYNLLAQPFLAWFQSGRYATNAWGALGCEPPGDQLGEVRRSRTWHARVWLHQWNEQSSLCGRSWKAEVKLSLKIHITENFSMKFCRNEWNSSADLVKSNFLEGQQTTAWKSSDLRCGCHSSQVSLTIYKLVCMCRWQWQPCCRGRAGAWRCPRWPRRRSRCWGGPDLRRRKNPVQTSARWWTRTIEEERLKIYFYEDPVITF